MKPLDGSVTTTSTGIDLHYRLWRGDGPPLVLMHGLASSLRIWDLAAPILAEAFTVLAYDQRGHGLSAKPGDGYDLVTETADLSGLLSALHIEPPVILAGHSWGASLALAYAVAHPGECAGVALIDGGLTDLHGVGDDDWDAVSARLAPPDLSHFTLDDVLEHAKSGDLADVPAGFLEDYFKSIMEVQPDGTIRARLSRENHMKILRTMWENRSTGLLAKVACPLLAVVAESEPRDERSARFMEAKRQGMAFAKSLPGRVKVVEMRNTIHDIPIQRPERLAGEIVSFFAPKRS